MALTRVKQLLMAIGLATVLGALAVVGLVGYLWYDTQSIDADATADFDASVDSSVDVDTDAEGEVEV